MVTRCFTSNDNSQLQYRSGVRVSETIDGTDVRDMPYFESMSPFLAKGTRNIQFVNARQLLATNTVHPLVALVTSCEDTHFPVC